MDASLVGAPVFKTVCVALILSQVGSIPTHLRHVCEGCYDIDNVHKKYQLLRKIGSWKILIQKALNCASDSVTMA